MSTRAKKVGDLRREITCHWCGGKHRRRSQEARECRARARAGKPPLSAPAPAPPPAPRTLGDPLDGDRDAHAIARKLRNGWPARKIAKYMGLPLAAVEEVIDKLGGQP